MSKLSSQISAIGALGQAIDGTRQPSKRLEKLRADPGSPVATRWRCLACGRYAFTQEDGLRHLAVELREAIHLLPADTRGLFVPPEHRQRRRQNRHHTVYPVFQFCWSDCSVDHCDLHGWGFVVDAGRKFDGRRNQLTRSTFRTAEEAVEARAALKELR